MVNIAGTELPLIVILPVAIAFLVLVSLVIILFLKRGNTRGEILEERIAGVLPVDENENMGVGKLLANVQRTENKILIPDPDVLDNEGQPKTFQVDITGLQPAKFIDRFKNIVEFWLVFDRGEWTAQSFASLLKNVKKRWDPLEADPQDIGDFYVGWGFMRKLNQFLQSTSGKILFGLAVGLIAYLLGIMTVALHVGHF